MVKVMAVESMVSLDLPAADSEQRKQFYSALRDSGWQKMPNVDTVWKACHDCTPTLHALEASIRDALDNASNVSGAKFFAWYTFGLNGSILKGHQNVTDNYRAHIPVESILTSFMDE
ncbi:hypothetical protein SN11_16895 [Vibrio harveyi]|nr:hypothetical protein SN11_16895 [Vibrio harveyi]